MLSFFISSFFFFQAEYGIRDIGVTGLQTCALPIYSHHRVHLHDGAFLAREKRWRHLGTGAGDPGERSQRRSEERRVGKECRSRWSPYQYKKKVAGVGGHRPSQSKDIAVYGWLSVRL